MAHDFGDGAHDPGDTGKAANPYDAQHAQEGGIDHIDVCVLGKMIPCVCVRLFCFRVPLSQGKPQGSGPIFLHFTMRRVCSKSMATSQPN